MVLIYNDTEELAENKLILLYILSKVDAPLSRNQIVQIVLENELMNYFSIQQYLTELVQKSLITHYEDMGKHLYSIKQKGLETLRLFPSRIPLKVKTLLRDYFRENKVPLSKQFRAKSNFSMNDKGVFSVVLRLMEGEIPTMEIKLKTEKEEDAEQICINWNANAKALYQSIKAHLVKNDKD